MTALTAVSLFAGVGGFDLACQRAGIAVAAAVEIDPACRRVLARHFPATALFADIQEVTGDQLRAAGFDPARGLLTAGFPCQDISVAGRRAGLAGARSGLFWHLVRLADQMRPRWVLVENTPGLLSSNRGRDMGTVLGALADLGYGLCWRVLDAQFFGLAQRRQRVFLAGCLGDGCAPVQVLLEPESRSGHLAPGRPARPHPAASAPGGLAGPGRAAVSTLQGGGRRGHRVDAEAAAGGHLITLPLAWRGRAGGSQAEAGNDGDPMFALHTGSGGGTAGMPMVAHALTAWEAKGPDSDATTGFVLAHTLTAEGADASDDGTGRGTPLVPVFAPLTAGSAASPGVNPAGRRVEDDWSLVTALAENQRGELVETPTAHALTSGGGKPGQGYPAVRAATAVRRLTPRECERLQGFPDDWTAGQSDAARYRQLGNAVAVPVATWITRRIARPPAGREDGAA